MYNGGGGSYGGISNGPTYEDWLNMQMLPLTSENANANGVNFNAALNGLGWLLNDVVDIYGQFGESNQMHLLLGILDNEYNYTSIAQFASQSRKAQNGGGSNLTGDPQLGLINHSEPIGLASTVWGGSVSAGVAEAARSGKYLTNVVKYIKVGGNVLGGVGFGVTTYNLGAKIYNGTDDMADYVDFAASGSMLVTGFLLGSNPVGWGILIGVGVTYGITRIAAGDEIDAWLNGL